MDWVRLSPEQKAILTRLQAREFELKEQSSFVQNVLEKFERQFGRESIDPNRTVARSLHSSFKDETILPSQRNLYEFNAKREKIEAGKKRQQQQAVNIIEKINSDALRKANQWAARHMSDLFRLRKFGAIFLLQLSYAVDRRHLMYRLHRRASYKALRRALFQMRKEVSIARHNILSICYYDVILAKRFIYGRLMAAVNLKRQVSHNLANAARHQTERSRRSVFKRLRRNIHHLHVCEGMNTLIRKKLVTNLLRWKTFADRQRRYCRVSKCADAGSILLLRFLRFWHRGVPLRRQQWERARQFAAKTSRSLAAGMWSRVRSFEVHSGARIELTKRANAFLAFWRSYAANRKTKHAYLRTWMLFIIYRVRSKQQVRGILSGKTRKTQQSNSNISTISLSATNSTYRAHAAIQQLAANASSIRNQRNNLHAASLFYLERFFQLLRYRIAGRVKYYRLHKEERSHYATRSLRKALLFLRQIAVNTRIQNQRNKLHAANLFYLERFFQLLRYRIAGRVKYYRLHKGERSHYATRSLRKALLFLRQIAVSTRTTKAKRDVVVRRRRLSILRGVLTHMKVTMEDAAALLNCARAHSRGKEKMRVFDRWLTKLPLLRATHHAAAVGDAKIARKVFGRLEEVVAEAATRKGTEHLATHAVQHVRCRDIFRKLKAFVEVRCLVRDDATIQEFLSCPFAGIEVAEAAFVRLYQSRQSNKIVGRHFLRKAFRQIKWAAENRSENRHRETAVQQDRQYKLKSECLRQWRTWRPAVLIQHRLWQAGQRDWWFRMLQMNFKHFRRYCSVRATTIRGRRVYADRFCRKAFSVWRDRAQIKHRPRGTISGKSNPYPNSSSSVSASSSFTSYCMRRQRSHIREASRWRGHRQAFAALRRWRAYRVACKLHRRLMRLTLHSVQRKALHSMKLYTRSQRRRELVMVGASRHHSRRRETKTLRWLEKVADILQATRQLRKSMTRKRLVFWQKLYQHRTLARRVLNTMLHGVAYSDLHAAFQEWREDVHVERVLLRYQAEKKNEERLAYLLRWVNVTRSQRRQLALQRRALNRQHENKLRSLFTGLMRHLDKKYRHQEKLKQYERYYISYLQRSVLQNLLFLRRNRIAYQFRVKKSFGIMLKCIRLRMTQVAYSKGIMHIGNRVIMRKLFERWLLRSRGTHGKKKSWETMPVILRRHAMIIKWRAAFVRYRAVRRWTFVARLWRRKGRVIRYSENHYLYYGARKVFKRLLQLRRLRRRSRQREVQYAQSMLTILMRKTFYKLDLYSSSQWAALQTKRLVLAHSEKALLRRGLRVLENNYISQFRRRLASSRRIAF